MVVDDDDVEVVDTFVVVDDVEEADVAAVEAVVAFVVLPVDVDVEVVIVAEAVVAFLNQKNKSKLKYDTKTNKTQEQNKKVVDT